MVQAMFFFWFLVFGFRIFWFFFAVFVDKNDFLIFFPFDFHSHSYLYSKWCEAQLRLCAEFSTSSLSIFLSALFPLCFYHPTKSHI